MRIQELEQKTGLERPTIRFYEREGLITPQRTENGYREYSEEDVSQLLKVKLLRQLGMSVEKIRRLQQGSEDFGQAMETQIAQLSSQIQEQKRARVICQTLRTDGVDYQNLDAAHYLQLLRQLPMDGKLPRKQDFQEDIPKEIHPWRRFFARTIDISLFSLLTQFLIFVIFRLRPIPEEFVMTLMGIGYGFLYLPVEALLLHKWGTTPGKWAMGIRLEWIQGGNLPYWEAIYRSWRVHKYGMAFGIPLVQLAFNVMCWRKLTGRPQTRWQKYNEIDPPTEMDWDDDTEIIYSPWEGKCRFRLLPLVIAYTLLFALTVCDIVKPEHRSSKLTVAQFAENFNSTLRLLNPDGMYYETLLSDGTITKAPDNVVILEVGGTSVGYERPEFVYETDEGILRTITFENSWEDIWYLQPLSGICQNAAIAALLSQPECGLPELYEFLSLWESHLDENIAEFSYENIEVSWRMCYHNATYNDGIFFADVPDTDSTVSLQFIVKIHDN